MKRLAASDWKEVRSYLAFSVMGLLWASSTYASDLVDPTRPSYVVSGTAAHAESVRKKYRLNSVLVGELRRMAVINGQRVREGEWVGEAKVTRINKSGVTLLVQDSAVNIALSAHDIKKQ